MPQSDTKFEIGEDLYGVSIAELETRIDLLDSERVRIEAELSRKKSEFSMADNLFRKKSEKP